ncbi:MAG: hypothetical protein IIB77_07205, partial [Proteobacteria bacterium]|nr:hypothetical protein [Pseudomonadota bacterium]
MSTLKNISNQGSINWFVLFCRFPGLFDNFFETFEDNFGAFNKSIVDAMKQAIENIQALQDNIALDPRIGGLNRQGRLIEAQDQFDIVKGKIRAGGDDAIAALDDLDRVSRNLLEASVDFFGSNSSQAIDNLAAV